MQHPCPPHLPWFGATAAQQPGAIKGTCHLESSIQHNIAIPSLLLLCLLSPISAVGRNN
jgi:hypothetical protein